MQSTVVFLIFSAVVGVLSQDAPPVKVDLYYETLCPYSIDYFVNQLYPTYVELKDIMDVHLFPFGNADYAARPSGEGWLFTCQHGQDECRGNMLHACAQKYITDIDTEMDFVNCMLTSASPPDSGAQCSTQVNIDYTPIEACINSVEGENALHDVAVIQEQLDPTLNFVPWILVDDVFSEVQVSLCQSNMKRVVCNHYTGTLPAECSTKAAINPLYGKHINKCYRN